MRRLSFEEQTFVKKGGEVWLVLVPYGLDGGFGHEERSISARSHVLICLRVDSPCVY